MNILAIDPGYDRCGVAIIDASTPKGSLIYSECIETSKKDPQEVRLATVYKSVERIILEYKPKFLALETLFFSINKKTAMKVAEARGVILLLAGIHNLRLIEISPQGVKLAVTGAGNTDKKAVQKMVSLILNINTDEKIDDEIDAIALGFAAIGHTKNLI